MLKAAPLDEADDVKLRNTRVWHQSAQDGLGEFYECGPRFPQLCVEMSSRIGSSTAEAQSVEGHDEENRSDGIQGQWRASHIQQRF